MVKRKPPPQPHNIVGNVKRILAIPCDTPPSVWVETALPAALKAIYSVAEPDPKEAYHKAFGNSLYHDYKTVLQDAEIVPPAEGNEATSFFFAALDWADLTAWFLFLADVALDGLMNWTTQIIKQTQCKMKGYEGQGHGTFFFGAIEDDGRWQQLDFSFPEGTDFYPVSPSSIVVPKGHSCIVAAQASFHLWASESGVPCATRLINITTGEILEQVDIADPTNSKYPKTHVFSKYANDTQDEHHVAVEWSWGGGPVATGQVYPTPEDCFCFIGIYKGG